MLRFRGSQHFRQRIVCSTLSGKSIRIDDIRSIDTNPGLRDYEACLLRLLEKLTNGCIIEINETGTSLRYKPGLITGGADLVHDCGTSRGIGYYLEPLVCLALFGKKPLSITLRGVTNDAADPSVDVWRTVTLPIVRNLAGIQDGLELKVASRGAAPQGGGEVMFKCPVVRAIPAVNLTDEGLVKRIRGVAYAMRVAPQNTNRMVDGARGVLNDFLADVYIFTDHMRGTLGGKSPAYGIALVAETTSGRYISAEAGSGGGAADQESDGGIVPEEIGQTAAKLLLEEINRGGVVDGTHQGLLLLLCAIGPKEMNTVRLGPLTPHAIRTLRHIRDFFGVTFNVQPQRNSHTIFISCIGAAITNLSKRVT